MTSVHREQNDPDFSTKLLDWFNQHGRKDLPWQQNKTPYRVWVSEIMLQQTQVQSVIAYYQRFMDSFETVEALAHAELDQVLEHWSGLGYYARARNLHKTAKLVVTEHGGRFPESVDGLTALPGIGRSTAGAILSIAFQQYATILDGNVKRVLCRYDQIETWSGERETEKRLWQRAEQLTPSHRTADYTQAIMDLGATCCTRSKPNCMACPMQSDCKAYAQNLQTTLPVSKPKKAKPTHHRWLFEIHHDEQLLLEKRDEKGIWGGLYSLPELDYELTLDQALAQLEAQFGFIIQTHETLDTFKHIFSHYTVIMHPLSVTLTSKSHSSPIQPEGFRWETRASALRLGLPAPIKKFLDRSCSQTQLRLE